MKKQYIKPGTVVVLANTAAALMENSRFQETGDPNKNGMSGEVKDGNDYTGPQRSKYNAWDVWEE